MVSSWQVPASEAGTAGEFGATPTLFTGLVGGSSANLVGMADKNGIYYALDRAAIAAGPVWQRRIAVGGTNAQAGAGSISSSAYDGTNVYVAGGRTASGTTICKGSVRALVPGTGTVLWTRCLRSGPVLGAVAAAPGVLAVGAGRLALVLDAATGAILFGSPSPSGMPFMGPASIANGVLYQGDASGTLSAFAPSA